MAKWVMVAFVNILDEVERRFERTAQPAMLPHICPAQLFAPFSAEKSVAIERVLAAYQHFQRQETQLAQLQKAKPESFSRLILDAIDSPEQLQLLRRELAWRLHPDRQASDEAFASNALAEVNAAIDAALARCRTNVPE